MSKPLKPRRGTTAEHAAFIGQAHEVTYDTDKQTLVCHDGLTAGGFPLARADEVAAKDAAQDEAIAEAQSSAEAASEEVTALDTALRQLIAEELKKYLPLAGGPITGDIWGATTSMLVSLLAHQKYGNSPPRINIFGEDFPDSEAYQGAVELIAAKGSTVHGLTVFPDGKISSSKYGDVMMFHGVANYEAAWWIGTANIFTAPSNGWLVISITIGESDLFTYPWYISVNHVRISRVMGWTGEWAGSTFSLTLPLAKDDFVDGLAPNGAIVIDTWFVPAKF